MATLNFKGKSLVWNHHLSVPYHQLVPCKDKSLTDKVRLDDNLIIHGDNLKALKALLPTYGGKVKCVYIDPPYNTGNEGWVYNDAVNSPMIKDWIGEVVDREDLTRHDKWLCMMAPRLKLLKEFMRDDGVIFISIDDNEACHLKTLMDEIFTESCFVATLVWKSKSGGASDVVGIATDHEYILAYSKTEAPKLFLDKLAEATTSYNLAEVDGRRYALDRLDKQSLGYLESLDFPIKGPGGKVYRVEHKDSQSKVARWRWGSDTVDERYDELVFKWPYIYTKNYEKDALIPRSLLIDERFGRTRTGKTELRKIFGKSGVFDHPKPSKLVQHLISISTEGDDVVLDCFAGSGVTGHATLAQNSADSSHRRFVMIESEDYADSVTAQRMRLLLKKGDLSEMKGGFSYFDIGDPMEIELLLSGKGLPSYGDMARFVFYSATGQQFDQKRVAGKDFFIGSDGARDVFLIYRPDADYLRNAALTLDIARGLKSKPGQRKIVFAPTKYLDQEQLDELGIDFAQLPYDLYKSLR